MNEDVIYGGPDGRPYVPKLEFDLLCKEVQKVVMEQKSAIERLKEFIVIHKYKFNRGDVHPHCIECGAMGEPCKSNCTLEKLLKI